MLLPQIRRGWFWALAFLMLNFWLAVLPVFAEPNREEGHALYQQALQFKSENRYSEAEEALTQALQREPANADYHFELSNIYAALYDTWRERPGTPQALTFLTRLQQSLQQTLIFRPDHLAAHFNLGVLYKRQGDYEDARNEFRRVLDLSPDLAAAWVQIGSTYQEQGFWDEAEDAYLRARELSENAYEINQMIQTMRVEREASEQAASRRPSFGGLGGQTGLGSLGGAQSLYGSVAGAANQQSVAPTSVLPSLAAMMIQQMLSRRGTQDEVS